MDAYLESSPIGCKIYYAENGTRCMTQNTAPRSADHPPGYDEHDPYEHEDITQFPEWWQTSIELFRRHEMRPYRPPMFADEVLTPEIIDELESELDVSIQFKAVNPRFGDDWGIWIDGEKAMTVGRRRTEEGRTVYGIDSRQFEASIRRVVSRERPDRR